MSDEEKRPPEEEVEDMINVFGAREACKRFTEHMLCMHRTLNQKFTGDIIIPFIKEMAERYKAENYDGRNQDACKCCSIMWDALVKEMPGFKYGGGLPMV